MNCPIGSVVDHINRNPLDNRKANLRICNQSVNIYNSKLFSTNKSGFRGVYFSKECHKWVAQICINRKNKSLGFYKSPEKAHEIYKLALYKVLLGGKYGNEYFTA